MATQPSDGYYIGCSDRNVKANLILMLGTEKIYRITFHTKQYDVYYEPFYTYLAMTYFEFTI